MTDQPTHSAENDVPPNNLLSEEDGSPAENEAPERRSMRTGRTAAEAAVRLRETGPWHEFDEDVEDGSMCMCGVPALYHDRVFPPGEEEVP